MKTMEKKETVTKIIYVAMDGTVFNDGTECQKYEESAEGIIRSRLKDSLKEISNNNSNAQRSMYFKLDGMFDYDACRSKYYIFNPKDKNDIDNFLQLLTILNLEYCNDSTFNKSENETDEEFKIRKEINMFLGIENIKVNNTYLIRMDREENNFCAIIDPTKVINLFKMIK